MLSKSIAGILVLAAAGTIALPVTAGSPYGKPDNTWISLSGTVESVSLNSFLLDYGGGVITVKMDDEDRDADAYKLLKGQQVVVAGLLDADVFAASSIEASSVYVEDIATRFSVNADDGQLAPPQPATAPISDEYNTVLRGVVTEIFENSFILNTGDRRVEVEVDEMAYDPLDDEGYQKVKLGDSVEVTGFMDSEMFEGRIFDARTLVVTVDGG